MQEPRHLGQKSELPTVPTSFILDPVSNPYPEIKYVARFTCPEFSSLCPVTSQPDFATMVIDYIPGKYLVESKSLKLYLGSYRNHQAFHEACVIQIGRHIIECVQPIWFRIAGYFNARGGIPIDVFYEDGARVATIPDLDSRAYRGR
jgi:7-cyano-7-deazaguanine reductase